MGLSQFYTCFCVLNVTLASVQFNDALCDCQPQTRSAAGSGFIHTIECVPNLLKRLVRQRRTLVFYREGSLSISVLDGHVHMAASSGILDGIGGKVLNHLSDPALIPCDGKIIWERKFYLEVFRLGCNLQFFKNGFC